jgi:hypothetical protein
MKFRDMFNRSDLTAAITGVTSTLTWLADGTGKIILFVLSVGIAWYTLKEKRLAVQKHELEIKELTSKEG